MKCSNEELVVYLTKMAEDFEDVADKDFDGQELDNFLCSDLYQIVRTYRECAKRIGEFESLDATEGHPPFDKPSTKKWQRPVLRDFTKQDYQNYPGTEETDPQIAEVIIEGIIGDIVVEPDWVGLYFVTAPFDPSMDLGETISFDRDFGRNDSDDFLNEIDLGITFSNWLIENLSENTMFKDLEQDFGFTRS